MIFGECGASYSKPSPRLIALLLRWRGALWRELALQKLAHQPQSRRLRLGGGCRRLSGAGSALLRYGGETLLSRTSLAFLSYGLRQTGFFEPLHDSEKSQQSFESNDRAIRADGRIVSG